MNDVHEDHEHRENMRNGEREARVGRAKYSLQEEFRDLHPVHRARAYREIQAHANEQARDQETTNDRDGVPE